MSQVLGTTRLAHPNEVGPRAQASALPGRRAGQRAWPIRWPIRPACF